MNNPPIYFATLDSLRGLGLEENYENFHILCYDYTEVVDMLIQDGIKVFCLEKELNSITDTRTTRDLLQHPLTEKYILETSEDIVNIAVFKPTFDIVRVLSNSEVGKLRKINSLNPTAVLSKKLENKLSFFDLCEQHNIPHTPAKKTLLHSIHENIFEDLQSNRLVIQFERGWFGNRTFFLNNFNEIQQLQREYSDRTVLISNYIQGKVLTNNIVITDNEILQTYPFFQINEDIHETIQLSRLEGSTVGNEWRPLEDTFGFGSSEILSQIRLLTEQLGVLLRDSGFRGYAGLDFIISHDGKIYVQELNARFTASVQMITQLERQVIGSSLLDAHFGISKHESPGSFFTPLQGARIIARNTTPEPIKISNFQKNGIYRVNPDGSYKFSKSGYKLNELTENQFLYFSASENRKVSPDEEIFQAQSTSITTDKLTALARTLKKDLLG